MLTCLGGTNAYSIVGQQEFAVEYRDKFYY
jgi:hypothetical protein